MIAAGCAIPNGRSIQQVDWIGNHLGTALVILFADRLAQTRKGIMHRVRMGVDRKWGKIRMLSPIFMQIALHDQGIDSHKR